MGKKTPALSLQFLSSMLKSEKVREVGFREESDSLGRIIVPDEHLWGAQTERARLNFAISTERFPSDFINALCLVKKAAAQANSEMGILDRKKALAIVQAADEVLAGYHDSEFPLSIWQTGSGTQTHMNMNEVLANRASELLGGARGLSRKVHPNDDVNRSQSSNDVFPSAMNISVVRGYHSRLVPSLKNLLTTLRNKSREFSSIIKIGRTHLMDATPLTLGQEWSGYTTQIEHSLLHMSATLPHLYELALGGTSVGTGLNAPSGFATRAIGVIAHLTQHPFVGAPNKFEAVANHDALVHFHGSLKGLACSLYKIASDIQLLSSGPRCGFGELKLPSNEPGSSIMPGKSNPTQNEALIMGCTQVIANDVAVSFAGASGDLELNTLKPIIIHAILQSIRILSDATQSFTARCLEGVKPQVEQIGEHLERSLMLVTALTPHIGYDASAKIVDHANRDGTTLRKAAVDLGLVKPADYDRWVDPSKMT